MKALTLSLGICEDEPPVSNGIVVSEEPWLHISVGKDSSDQEIRIPLDKEWSPVKRVITCSLAKLPSGNYRILGQRSEDAKDGKLLLLVLSRGWQFELPAEGLKVVAEGVNYWRVRRRLFVLEKAVRFSVVDLATSEVTFVGWDGERLRRWPMEAGSYADPRDEPIDGAVFL